MIQLEKGKPVECEIKILNRDLSSLDLFAERLKVLKISIFENKETPIKNFDNQCLKFKILNNLQIHSLRSISIVKAFFDPFVNVTSLQFECPSIENLPEFIFAGLNRLNFLKLCLKYAELNENHFKGLENLETLEIIKIELNGELDCLVNLKKLYLQHINLSKFTFLGLKKLKKLKFSEINLTLNPEKIVNFKRLQSQFIQNFQKLGNLEIIELEFQFINLEIKILLDQILYNMPTSVNTLSMNSDYFNQLCTTNKQIILNEIKYLKINIRTSEQAGDVFNY